MDTRVAEAHVWGDPRMLTILERSHAREGFELFPHEADIGLRGWGPTKEKAFEEIALALTAAITDPRHVEPREPVSIRCEAPDDPLLLVEWLNALIYEMVTLRMLFGRFTVQMENGALQATAWGEPLDPERHAPAVEPKGATCTDLRLEPVGNGRWLAQCVVNV